MKSLKVKRLCVTLFNSIKIKKSSVNFCVKNNAKISAAKHPFHPRANSNNSLIFVLYLFFKNANTIRTSNPNLAR
jgi:hypothetical protein